MHNIKIEIIPALLDPLQTLNKNILLHLVNTARHLRNENYTEKKLFGTMV
jgi:hypothetical protein